MEATDQIFNKQCETTDGVAELHKDDGQCYWDEVGGVGGGGWCGVGGGGWGGVWVEDGVAVGVGVMRSTLNCTGRCNLLS